MIAQRRVGNVVYLEPPPTRRSLDQMLDDVDQAVTRDEVRRAAYRASLRPQKAEGRDAWESARQPSQFDGVANVALGTMAVLVAGAVVGLALSILMQSPG